MRRGELVVVAAAGGYAGKPRPALVVQSNLFNETHGSVTLCLLTSTLIEAPLFRVLIEPTSTNGLRETSQVMVDKLFSAPRHRIGPVLGEVDTTTMSKVEAALHLWLQL